MNDPSAQTAASGSVFEALRERWRKAKADGTTEAFALELWEQGTAIAPPPAGVYASEAERAAYERARAFCPPKPSDLLAVLPLYFGDDRVLDALDHLGTRNGPAGKKDDAPN
jgi:hypothetical protein